MGLKDTIIVLVNKPKQTVSEDSEFRMGGIEKHGHM